MGGFFDLSVQGNAEGTRALLENLHDVSFLDGIDAAEFVVQRKSHALIEVD
jgi:hypothetical protein